MYKLMSSRDNHCYHLRLVQTAKLLAGALSWQ